MEKQFEKKQYGKDELIEVQRKFLELEQKVKEIERRGEILDVARMLHGQKTIDGFAVFQNSMDAFHNTGSFVSEDKLAIRIQAFENLAAFLKHVPEGNVAELGAWRGASSYFMLSFLDHIGRNHLGQGYYIFDSFEGSSITSQKMSAY